MREWDGMTLVFNNRKMRQILAMFSAERLNLQPYPAGGEGINNGDYEKGLRKKAILCCRVNWQPAISFQGRLNLVPWFVAKRPNSSVVGLSPVCFRGFSLPALKDSPYSPEPPYHSHQLFHIEYLLREKW
jgi:hypothetical protein